MLDFNPERLKEARAEKKITQEVTARLVGVTVLAVKRWESGARKPAPRYIKRLAEVFGKAMEYFFT